MTTRAGALLSILGLTSAATAQLPSFVYHIDAPTSMAPGQTATITVLCGFTPPYGSMVTTVIGPGVAMGLASGRFDLFGDGGYWTLGVPPNGSLLFPYNFIGTTHGTPAGGSVSGVTWGNGFGPPLGTISTLNPTPLWSATFTAPLAGRVTLTVHPVGQHVMWAHALSEIVPAPSLNTTGAQAVIQVIPTPASLALLGVGLLTAAQRRRSRP